MTRRADWDATGKVLVLSFPFDRALNQAIRELGGQFDWISKTWRFTHTDALAVIPRLEALGFTVAASPHAPRPKEATPTTRGSHSRDRREPLPQPKGAAPTTSGWSISALNAHIQRALEGGLPREIWIIGKVSGAQRIRRQGHAYFNLVEEDHHGETRASVAVSLFADARRHIERQLLRRELKLEDGLQLRVRGRVDLWAARGSLSFVIDDIDAAYSEGALALKREEVLRQLRAEGLATRNKGLPLPTLPLRIALVTSAESDAYHDALKTLAASGYSFEVRVFDVRVQGAQLTTTVTRALTRIADHADHFDVCLIVRGGGSRVELAGWDDLAVGRAVATLPLKVVIGIGHEQDASVLDAIAHSEKTPTAAAQHMVHAVDRASRELGELDARLSQAPVRRLRDAERRLLQVGEQVLAGTTRAMQSARLEVDARLPSALRASVLARLDAKQRELARAATTLRSARAPNALRRAERELQRASTQLERRAQQSLRDAARRLEAAAEGLKVSGPQRLKAAQLDLLHLETGARLRDPKRVLERGYALVRDAAGRVVTHHTQLSPGDPVTLELVDGAVPATIGEEP